MNSVWTLANAASPHRSPQEALPQENSRQVVYSSPLRVYHLLFRDVTCDLSESLRNFFFPPLHLAFRKIICRLVQARTRQWRQPSPVVWGMMIQMCVKHHTTWSTEPRGMALSDRFLMTLTPTVWYVIWDSSRRDSLLAAGVKCTCSSAFLVNAKKYLPSLV